MFTEGNSVKIDAKLAVRVLLAGRYDRIAQVAEERYMNGIEIASVKMDGSVVKFVKYETDEARVAIAANQAVGKMIGIDEPTQIKSEVVTLTPEEKGIKDELERQRRNGELPTKPDFS